MNQPIKRSVLRSVKRGIVAGSGGITPPVTILGNIFPAGENSSYQLGDGTTTDRQTFSALGSDTWITVAAGKWSSGAINDDGELFTWGYNASGQLGQGDKLAHNTPATQVGTDTDWDQLQAGEHFYVARKTDGTLWTWGNATSYHLGNGNSTTDVEVPTQVGTDTDWATIYAGSHHGAGLKTDGTWWRWGRNSSGECSTGNTIDIQTPTQFGTDTDWADVSLGNATTMMVKSDNTLWMCGWNGDGEQGNGSKGFTPTNILTQVGTDEDWTRIAAGKSASAAIKDDNTLWSWGKSTYGQLGNGTTTPDVTVPTQVGADTDWDKIYAGWLSDNNFAIKTEGTLWGFGEGKTFAFGNGSETDLLIPTKIGSSTNNIFASPSFRFTHILRSIEP